MKHPAQTALLILAAWGLTALSPAMAEPAATPAAPAASAEHANCAWKGEEKGAWLEKNLETLREALKLTPAQEPAWAEWAGKAKAVRSEGKEWRKDFESWDKLTAVERLEKMLAKSKERQAKLEAQIAATKTFYATLSAEQKPVFDQQWAFRPHGRGRH
jgi:hypothetical protein